MRNKQEVPEVREFAAWLIEQNGGKTHAELGTALHDLVSAVVETGKKGTLTFIVTAECVKGSDGVLGVTDKIQLKLPEPPRPTSIAYVDEDGNLTRRNPKQMEFGDVREPEPRTGEVKDIYDNEAKGAAGE